jgi:hypothetical protein
MSWCRAPPCGPWPDYSFSFLCQTIVLLFVLGRPLWREDYWVPFPSPLTTRRDYGGSTLTRLYTGNILILEFRGYFTTDSQSVCLGVEHPCGTCDQLLLLVELLLSEICDLVSVGPPLWRGDRSAICSVITQWSESLRTRNHTLLSHLRLVQPGGSGSRIYIPQEQDGPVISPGTGFALRRLLRVASYDYIPSFAWDSYGPMWISLEIQGD